MVDAQVPEELLEFIDKDSRLSNDWQGLTNEEKQLMINNYQPNTPIDQKLMTRSSAIGDFISTYNILLKKIAESEKWFADDPLDTPEELATEQSWRPLPTGGYTKKEVLELLKTYKSYPDESKRKVLQQISLETMEEIAELRSKSGMYKLIDSFIEDWNQVHEEGAGEKRGPLQHRFTQGTIEGEEDRARDKPSKELGEKAEITSLSSLIREWKEAMKLDEAKFAEYSNIGPLSILLRIAKEIGIERISRGTLIDEDILVTQLEEHLNNINDTFEDWSSKDINDSDIESLIIRISSKAGRGFIQWGVLQDLVHQQRQVFYSPERKYQIEAIQGKRYSPEIGETTYGETGHPTITEGGGPLAQLTPKGIPVEKNWMIQIQSHRGRSASNSIYSIPLYLCVVPEVAIKNFKKIKFNKGDWLITCDKGVFIYFEYGTTTFTIIDNDTGARIKINNITNVIGLRTKLNRLKKRKSKTWEDIIEVFEKLIASATPMGEEKMDGESYQAIALERLKDLYGSLVKYRDAPHGRLGATSIWRKRKNFLEAGDKIILDYINLKTEKFREDISEGVYNDMLYGGLNRESRDRLSGVKFNPFEFTAEIINGTIRGPNYNDVRPSAGDILGPARHRLLVEPSTIRFYRFLEDYLTRFIFKGKENTDEFEGLEGWP